MAKTQIFTNDVSLQNCVKRHHPELIFADEIHMLGIDFNKTQDNAQSNWKKIVFRINSLATLHRERKLTLFGKVQVINTLLIPVIIHKAKILIPPPEILKQFNTILYKFLWHPNPIENLSRKKLIAHKDQGGIAIVVVVWRGISSKTDGRTKAEGLSFYHPDHQTAWVRC